MQAVMYGAGNIGRGFVGALLSQSGYRVIFIDVAPEVVHRLQTEGRYSVRIVSDNDFEDTEICNVDAVRGGDTEAAAEAIAGADIMATAVGVNALKFIVPNIAEGLRRRFRRTEAPLNILICENLPDANVVFKKMLKEQLTEDERAVFDRRVGLVEASIGRMVPVQTVEMNDGDPLRVCVERYGFLPTDKDAFKGEIPDIHNLIPYSPFGFFLKRKLYIHNMGHAVCAYLGLYAGDTFIYEAVENADIFLIAKNAMLESMEALSKEYGSPVIDLYHHIDDLLLRFTNRALGDTCARVGKDTARKLGASDRLIGAARLCMTHGIMPVHILIGGAAALYRHLLDNELPQTKENALGVLREITEQNSSLSDTIMRFYDMFRCGTCPARLRKAAVEIRKSTFSEVV